MNYKDAMHYLIDEDSTIQCVLLTVSLSSQGEIVWDLERALLKEAEAKIRSIIANERRP